MGRPLNKRFFQFGTGSPGFQIGCEAWFTGEGSSELGYIISQRSNSKYLVGSSAGGATPTRTEVLTLVQGNTTGGGQMQVEVTPELFVTALEATFTFDSDGTVDAITITDGGSGYFTDGTFTITTASGKNGNDDAVITYTVSNQVIVTAVVTTPGSGYDNQSGTSVDSTDIPDELAAGDQESARIINAHTVKTFEGRIYTWPAAVPLVPSASGRDEADLQEET